MRASSLLFLLPLPIAAAPAAALPPEPPLAQDEEEKEIPDKRPEIKELVDRLGEQIGDRGKQDTEAIATIDTILAEFPKSGPKDRQSLADALSDCFDVRRLEIEEGVPDNRLYMTAATALGEMGPESVKVLTKWIGHKKRDDDVQVQRRLILSLGKTKSEDGLKTLLKTLDHHDPAIVASGAEALANFSEAELDTRKDVFQELLKVLMSAKGAMDSDVNDLIARERYEVLGAPLITSLGALSRQDIRDPAEWQRWWNKNKKADWDQEAGE